MSRVPPPDGSAEFLALTGLRAGEIGLVRAAIGLLLRIDFDSAVFPCCWLFASYGKLLGHYTVVLEPATGPHLSLAEAVSAGSSATLGPGEALETEVCYEVTAAP